MKSKLFKIIMSVLLALLIVAPHFDSLGMPAENSISNDGYIQGEYIIQYDTGSLFSAFSMPSVSPSEVLLKYQADTVDMTSDGLALVVTEDALTQAEEQDFIREMESLPMVMTVERNRIVTASLVDDLASPYNDPLAGEQWGLDSIRAFTAWSNDPETTTTIRIAVIDTGVDSTHPDLTNRVIGGYNTLDTNSAGQHYNEDDTMDDHGHGTHVAGIIAAVCGNGFGIQGAMGSVNVEILPVKALNDNGRGSTYSLLRALDYAAEQNADIINLSLGSNYPSDLERESIRNAQNKNCLVIAAAGNEATNVSTTYPASYQDVISVGSVDRDDTRSYFSNYGATLDIAAPGGMILSTVPKATAIQERANGNTVYGDDVSGYYIAWSGTSMATPYVSAAAALYKSANPGSMNYDIGNHLIQTARDVGPIGKDTDTGAGIVDAAAAVGSEMIKTALRLLSPTGGSELYETVNFRVQVNTSMGVKGVRFYLNDTDTAPVSAITCDGADSYYDCVFDTTGVQDGTYTLIAVACDEDGDVVGEPVQTSVTIINHITDGFTLKIARPDGSAAGSAHVIVYGADSGGAYHRLKSAYTTSFGYARIKGLMVYEEYLIVIHETYANGGGNTHFVYRREAAQNELGSTFLIDGTASTLGSFSMKGKDGGELSQPYLMVAPAYETGGVQSLLTTYSAWRISSGDKIYLDDGLYGLYAYAASMDAGQAGTAYYLTRWNEVENGVNDIVFDYREAVLVKPVFDSGVTGTLRLEQIPGESIIPFFSGAITASEIYLPAGIYNATADVTATKDDRIWSMQLSKPEPVKAEGQLVTIPFSASVSVTEFSPNAGLNEDNGVLYMFRGDTLRTKNVLGDATGNIIRNITGNYPTFSVYQLTGEQKTLIYQATDRYLGDACHWFSSSNYIGSTAPGVGTYLAELSFDPSPFSEKSAMSFQFELRDKDGVEKQGVNLRMGGYHLPQAQVDIYAWEEAGWVKCNAGTFSANTSGYLEISKDLNLSSQGINLAVITHTRRQSGYSPSEIYNGYQIVPFSRLSELETVDVPEGRPVTVNNYDKSGNRMGAALYLPVMSDAGGRLAKPYPVDLVRLDITNSYGGYALKLPEEEYAYAFTSFQSIGAYYYLQRDSIRIKEGATVTFDGRESKTLTLSLPSGYSTYTLAPNPEKGGFVINAASATKFLLSPGAYQPSLTVNYGDTRLSIKAGQPLDLSDADRIWAIDADITPRFSLSAPIVPINQSLTVNGSLQDKFGNILTAAARKQGFDYVPYAPAIELTGPDALTETLGASYQSFTIPSSAYRVPGHYAFCFVYDAGQGERRSDSIPFSVGDGSTQIVVEQDARYTSAYGDSGEVILTMQDSVKGFYSLTAQIMPSQTERTVTFTHMRGGSKIGSIARTRVFSAGNNTVQCGFNLQPGDTVTIQIR